MQLLSFRIIQYFRRLFQFIRIKVPFLYKVFLSLYLGNFHPYNYPRRAIFPVAMFPPRQCSKWQCSHDNHPSVVFLFFSYISKRDDGNLYQPRVVSITTYRPIHVPHYMPIKCKLIPRIVIWRQMILVCNLLMEANT